MRLHAIAESPVLCHADLVAGCALQMRHRVEPITGLGDLVLHPSAKDTLVRIVQWEKARSVLYGQWGVDAAHRRI